MLGVNPAIVRQQNIFARVQVSHILVSVVYLHPRRGEILGQLRHLVLHVGVVGQVAKLADVRSLGPLGVGPVFRVQVRVECLADAVAENPRNDDEDAKRSQKDKNARDLDVALLKARRCVDFFRSVILRLVHVQAPEFPQDADR